MRSAFLVTLGLFTAAAAAPVRAAVVLSNNLSNASAGAETASGSNWFAASFTTDASAHTLSSVSLLLRQSASGSASVAVYNDDGLDEPGALVSTLTSPAAYGASLAPTDFTSAAGVSIAASTTYWVVLHAGGGGGYDWSFTADSSGSGVGFTHTWSESLDGGTSWFTDDTFPLQMSVTADVPEPTTVALLAGLVLLARSSRRRRAGTAVDAAE